MKRKHAYGGLAALGIVVFCVFTWFKQKVDRQEHLNTALLPNETRKLVKKGNTLTLVHRDKDGREVKKIIKGARDFSVSEDINGKVTVYAPTKGWIFEPGLAVVGGSDRLRYGVDLGIAYWNNFTLGGIIATDSQFSIRIGLVGMYNVYSNTSIFLGVDQTEDMMIGVRVRL